MKTCKICGQPVAGKAKYCDDCRRAKEREYQRNRYNNDDEYRQRKINSAKRQQQKSSKLGSLHRYSEHSKSDFDKEYQVVQNMKKASFKGKANGKKATRNNGENYNVEAYERYNAAVSYEHQKLDTFKKCPICGGTVFERMNGMIVCMTCGTCEEVFADSVFGFSEWTAEDMKHDFIRALRGLGDK